MLSVGTVIKGCIREVGAGAHRVRECVKRAGFKPAATQRCQSPGGDLLFG